MRVDLWVSPRIEQQEKEMKDVRREKGQWLKSSQML